MNRLVRLLLAVVALLFLCPIAHPESVSLFQETGWGRDDASSLPHQHTSYTFRTQGAEILIGSEQFPVSESLAANEPTEWFSATSLEETLWQLVRPVPAASPVVSATSSGASAEQRAAGDSGQATASGFYNEVVFQAWREAQLLIPLDAYFSLLGGTLFYDASTDPLSRFSFQPGSTNMTQTSFLFAETQRAGGEIVRYWENLSFSPLQAVLLVLLGFALALLPALFRRLRFLVRFMPAMPGKIRETVDLLSKDFEIQPNQIETIQYDPENDMKKRQRMVVKRDESWRKNPPVPAVEIAPINGRAMQTTASDRTEISVSSVPVTDSRQPSPPVSPSGVSRAQSVQPLLPEPVAAAPLSYAGPTRSQRRQPSSKVPASTRIYRLSPPTGTVSRNEPAEFTDRNGSAETHQEYINGAAEQVAGNAAVQVAAKAIEPPPVVAEPVVKQAPPATEPAPRRVKTPPPTSEPVGSQNHEAPPAARRWFDSFSETTNSTQVEEVEADSFFNRHNRQSKPAEAEAPTTSFRELRTGAILQWLEGRVPALTEAVAWDEEHLAEYRGLPFASITLEEGEGEPKTAQEVPGF